ncbi:MAG TPA: NB-ARC domain-containing protein [Xanthobacteraceae bacterium]|jgi:hypothetical protein|nr:NB-ARC domain-containing protein [Xanthobacteraceae bacterium]
MGWLRWLRRGKSSALDAVVRADHGGVAIGGGVRNSQIKIGLDEEEASRRFAEAQRPFMEKLAALDGQREKRVGAPPGLANLERVYAILPSHHNVLYGRGQELETLAQMLSRESPHKGVAIQAIGGMGKTALARECCVKREIWKLYDVVLGAQALKRQISVDTRGSQNNVIRFDQMGTVLGSRDLLVTIGGQLGVRAPDTRTDSDLEGEILRQLDGKSALVIVDNLETVDSISDVLGLLERICVPPTRRALMTTRRFPEDHSQIAVISLSAIQDQSACRSLVVNRLGDGLSAASEAGSAIDAILEIGHGHPLALELLAGKLITQGQGAVLKLRQDWAGRAPEKLNDEFLSVLCENIFDDAFFRHIGEMGANLLYAMAITDDGIAEDSARKASGLPDQQFRAALDKLFEASCIHRELRGDFSLLAMHPITQTYFRSRFT